MHAIENNDIIRITYYLQYSCAETNYMLRIWQKNCERCEDNGIFYENIIRKHFF